MIQLDIFDLNIFFWQNISSVISIFQFFFQYNQLLLNIIFLDRELPLSQSYAIPTYLGSSDLIT